LSYGPFVLDASLTLSWAFDGEATPFTKSVARSLQTVHAVTPALWPFEVASVLAIAERRGRITPGDLAEFLEWLRLAPILTGERGTVSGGNVSGGRKPKSADEWACAGGAQRRMKKARPGGRARTRASAPPWLQPEVSGKG